MPVAKDDYSGFEIGRPIGWSDQEKHDQAFSDAILGQDRATSAPTGESYVVPWNAWNATGPQGAGYYRATPGGGSELLDVQP